MHTLRRLFSRRPDDSSTPLPAPDPIGPSGGAPLDVVLYGGSHDLEVVGDSYYQDALWQLVGGRTTERIRMPIRAVLVADSDNPYDSNAISVWIDGATVGHLSREDAEAYRPGLLTLQAREGKAIALTGVIVGGGIREDGPGYLGVWMSHDPADFGITAVVPPPSSSMRASMRTGLTEALLTDEQDDSYDLSWLQRLPSDPISAIGKLRQLLQHDPDPIDRHFMYCELEERLYRSRDAFASALDEYDDTCARHDAEMDGIRDALLTKFGKVPLLDTYRQMAVRQQKAKNWTEAIRWAERGLGLYGPHAARPEAVEDLQKRVRAYRAKLLVADKNEPKAIRTMARPADQPSVEILICANCGGRFERTISRGRKPYPLVGDTDVVPVVEEGDAWCSLLCPAVPMLVCSRDRLGVSGPDCIVPGSGYGTPPDCRLGRPPGRRIGGRVWTSAEGGVRATAPARPCGEGRTRCRVARGSGRDVPRPCVVLLLLRRRSSASPLSVGRRAAAVAPTTTVVAMIGSGPPARNPGPPRARTTSGWHLPPRWLLGLASGSWRRTRWRMHESSPRWSTCLRTLRIPRRCCVWSLG